MVKGFVATHRYGNGSYEFKVSEGTGVIKGRVNLIGPSTKISILVYKPGHLQSDPELPDQLKSWNERLDELDRNPCDSTWVRSDDASGWFIVEDGQDQVLEAESQRPGDVTILFAPDICVVVPGHAVFKFENVEAQTNRDLYLPIANLPPHPANSAGWVANPGD